MAKLYERVEEETKMKKLNKKAKTGVNTAAWALFGLLLVMFIAAAWWLNRGPTEGTQAATIITQSAGGAALVGSATTCPQDLKNEHLWRYEDTISSTISYLGTVKLVLAPETSGKTMLYPTNSTAGDYTTDSNLIECDPAAPATYKPIALTRIDNPNGNRGVMSFAADPKKVDSGDYKYTIPGKSTRYLQVRVKDMVGDRYLNQTTGRTITDIEFKSFGADNLNYSDQAPFTNLNLDQNEYYDVEFNIKANATNSQWGEDGLRTWACVDTAATVWDEPVVTVDGVKKLDVKNSGNNLPALPVEANKVLSGFEYCFETGLVSDTEKKVRVVQKASSANPAAADSPIWRFIAEGRALSDDNKDTILVDVFDDETGRELVTWESQQAKIAVS